MNAKSSLPIIIISAVQKYMFLSMSQMFKRCEHLQAADMHCEQR